ncbi:hypothetical protein SDC9_136446 [bioreactor metagenome]|uniref:Dockerin domain-containing protein n=1 Tax=bioreactor metagenome TaxID=1076179 RepID=A0A645DJ96_9ZZZZ
MWVVRSGDVYVDHNNLYRYDKEITEYLSELYNDYPPNYPYYPYGKSVVFKPYNNENFSLFDSEIKSQNFDDIKIDETTRTITFNSYPGVNSLSCYNYGNSTKTSAFQFNIPENENISLTDNLYTFTRPVGSNKIVTTLTLKDTTNYYKTSQYTLIINFTVKGITASNNAPTVIDKNHGFIYGLTEGIKNLDGYVAAEEGNLQYVPTPKGFGTGSTVQLIFNGEVMQTYTIVIFGDLNGDGVVDAFDQTDMISTVNFETQYEENSSSKFAGDLNGDGVLDAFDLSIITAAGNYEFSIDQSGV